MRTIPSFTKGKWEFNGKTGQVKAGTDVIAYVYNAKDKDSTPTALANARLITAAPDLYSILERLNRTIHWQDYPDGEEIKLHLYLLLHTIATGSIYLQTTSN